MEEVEAFETNGVEEEVAVAVAAVEVADAGGRVFEVED